MLPNDMNSKNRKKAHFIAIIPFALIAILLCASYSCKKAKDQPSYQKWSIGVYTGDSPFTLGPAPEISNPVLTAEDVSDRKAVFVADPFMVPTDDNWYMFFEIFDKQTNQGDIGVAESADGHAWQYQRIVLDEPFHLSYPYVFKHNDTYFMIPESHIQNAIRLYQAVEFPTQWKFVGTLIDGKPFRDTCIIHFLDTWWIFTASTPKDTLNLYYAEDLMGPWIEHPMSPIVQMDPNTARPGGRMMVLDNNLVRFAQDCDPVYGNSIHAFIITELTKTTYTERPVDHNPILGPSGAGWNQDGMHQIDAHPLGDHSWIASVDGFRMEP